MKKISVLLFVLLFVFGFSMPSFAAVVRERLTAPEAGWQRFDDTHPYIVYEGWTTNTPNSNFYNSTRHYNISKNNKVTFYFHGTKVRIIAGMSFTFSNNVQVKVDGVQYTYSVKSSTNQQQVLVFEKVGLPLGDHVVEIWTIGSYDNSLDAIDIDESGSLLWSGPPGSASVSLNSVSYDFVDLSFSAFGANRLIIYRDDVPIYTVDGSSGSYRDSSVQSSTTYRYYVRAENVFGATASSVLSVRTLASPPPPSAFDLQLVDVKDKSIRISFLSLNADEYEVYRDGELITKLPGNSTGYTYSVSPSTTYRLWLVAVNNFGRTASNILEVTTQEELVPPYDLTFSLSKAYEDRIDLSFDVKKAESILVYRNGKLLTTLPGDRKFYSDTGLSANTEYRYKVVAKNALGSVSSDELLVKTLRPPVTDIPKVYLVPDSKVFLNSMKFEITSNDPDASLFYSFDGNTWEPYTGPVTVSETKDVYAKAVNVLGVESSVVVARYVFNETPKIMLGVDLGDVASSSESNFHFLWPIIAFCSGVVGAFVAAQRFRGFGG